MDEFYQLVFIQVVAKKTGVDDVDLGHVKKHVAVIIANELNALIGLLSGGVFNAFGFQIDPDELEIHFFAPPPFFDVFQGIATAALNPKVTALTVFVPGGGNLTGFLEGQPSGWPGWVNSQAKGAEREAKIKTAGYYDANNFAKRIKCPVLVGTGLADTISNPLTQFTMFNNITAPKRMVLMPGDEHISPHTAYKAVQSAWCKAIAAGEPVPMK